MHGFAQGAIHDFLPVPCSAGGSAHIGETKRNNFPESSYSLILFHLLQGNFTVKTGQKLRRDCILCDYRNQVLRQLHWNSSFQILFTTSYPKFLSHHVLEANVFEVVFPG